MSTPFGRAASSHPSRWVSTISRRRGSPISGTAIARPRRVDPHLPPGPDGFRTDAQAFGTEPFLGPRERLDQRRLGPEDDRVPGQLARGSWDRQVEHRAQSNASRAVLRLDCRRFQRGGAPADLLRLLGHRLEQLWAAEGCLPSRFLEREHRRAKLVAEPTEQVVAMLLDELLAELGAAPCRP